MNKKTNTINTTNQNAFSDLLRQYEQQATNRTPQTEKAYTETLSNLATAIAYSVLKKCIETSQNPTLVQVKKDVAKDTAIIQGIRYTQENALDYKYNQNGEMVRIVKDADLKNELSKLCATNLGEGLDLVNTAIISIMEETEKARERNGGNLIENFMEEVYTIRKLNRKVWIKIEDSVNGWETVNTTAIQETYKAVRRMVEQSRAVQTDARNGYTYLEELSTDNESDTTATVYRRLPKYADLGGAVCDFNGKETVYTANEQTVRDMDSLVESLNLSKRQAEILKLRLCGYGYKAIATYLGVTHNAIINALKKVQNKAIAIGLQPCIK